MFYFPAILALSVAFRTEFTLAFASAAVAVYGMISLATFGGDDGQALIARLLMLVAVAVCGNVYWRTERDRRRAAGEVLDGGPQRPQRSRDQV